jgi:hypothetical protein
MKPDQQRQEVINKINSIERTKFSIHGLYPSQYPHDNKGYIKIDEIVSWVLNRQSLSTINEELEMLNTFPKTISKFKMVGLSITYKYFIDCQFSRIVPIIEDIESSCENMTTINLGTLNNGNIELAREIKYKGLADKSIILDIRNLNYDLQDFDSIIKISNTILYPYSIHELPNGTGLIEVKYSSKTETAITEKSNKGEGISQSLLYNQNTFLNIIDSIEKLKNYYEKDNSATIIESKLLNQVANLIIPNEYLSQERDKSDFDEKISCEISQDKYMLISNTESITSIINSKGLKFTSKGKHNTKLLWNTIQEKIYALWDLYKDKSINTEQLEHEIAVRTEYLLLLMLKKQDIWSSDSEILNFNPVYTLEYNKYTNEPIIGL